MAKETAAEIATKYSIAPHREGEFAVKGDVTLYLPKSYKPSILIGGAPESSVAIVTGWSDPQLVVGSEVLDKVALAASVRTPVGIQLMLANLARNPHVQTIIRRASGSTNNTDRGQVPIDIMDALFKKEFDEDGKLKGTVDDKGQIIGTGFKLRPELIDGGGLEVIKQVLANVELVDISDQEKPDILAEVMMRNQKKVPYFPLPVHIPEFAPVPMETWPSERIGVTVRGDNAFETWIELVDKVIRYGKQTVLESAVKDHPQLSDRSEIVVRELPFAVAVLDGNNPFPFVPLWAMEEEALTLTPEKLENYYQDAYRPEKHMKEIFPGVFVYEKDNKYKYGEEMHRFPNSPKAQELYQSVVKVAGFDVANRAIADNLELDEATLIKVAEVMSSDLDDAQKAWVLSHVYYPAVNQYQIAIDRLRAIPDDADKVIFFWSPLTHGQQLSGRPCLNRLGILAREGKLHALSEFRSHDSKSWLENIYGVWRTIQDMAKETGFGVGEIVTVSDSLHIYEQDRDWMARLWGEQFCDPEVSLVFSDKPDPRGNIIITSEDSKVTVSLTDPETGNPIAQFEPSSVREAIAQLRHFGWTSQTGHALYIGTEIQNAFLAGQLDVEYEQDRPQVTRRGIQQKIEGK